MTKVVTLQQLLNEGYIHAGLIVDKNGRSAFLHADGFLSKEGSLVRYTLTEFTRQHAYECYFSVKKHDPWRYWRANANGSMVQLWDMRELVKSEQALARTEMMLKNAGILGRCVGK